MKRMCGEVEGLLKKDGEKEKLDMLVLSAGILTMQGRTPTADGLDVKMALHCKFSLSLTFHGFRYCICLNALRSNPFHPIRTILIFSLTL